MKLKYDITYYQDSSVKISRQDYFKKQSDLLLHDHDFLTVSFLLTGSLLEHTPEGTAIVKPGNVLIKPPGVMHANIFTDDCAILSFKIYDWKYYHFNFENWRVIEQYGLMKPFLNVVHNQDKKDSLIELESTLTSIPLKLDAAMSIPARIQQVKQLINKYFLEIISIGELAKEVNLNPVYLGKAFKDFYKIDIKSYQQQLRMHHAISKMYEKQENLTQIAYSTGHADQSHFSRVFKKNTNFSPKNFLSLLNL